MSGSDLRIRRRETARRRCSSRLESSRLSFAEVLYKSYRKKHGSIPLILGQPSRLDKSKLVQAVSNNRLDRKRWTRYLAAGEGPLPKGWFGPFKAGPSPLDIQHRTDPLTSAGRLWMMRSMQLRRDHVLIKIRPLTGGHLTTREAITFLDTNGITWEITGGGRVTGSDQNRAPAIRNLYWRLPPLVIADDYIDASERAQALLSGTPMASWNGTRLFTLDREKIDRVELVSSDGQRFDLTAALAGDIATQMAALPRPTNPRLAKIEAWPGAQGFAVGVGVSKTWRQVEREPLTARGLKRAIELVEAVETYPARMAVAVARVEAVRASASRPSTDTISIQLRGSRRFRSCRTSSRSSGWIHWPERRNKSSIGSRCAASTVTS